ncbi:F0F1 ATP synthase subunit delta [Patescibacteria group bacterium]|nr:F0F1 ATP synthase subunit delta [Patescibacteria group bacterium]
MSNITPYTQALYESLTEASPRLHGRVIKNFVQQIQKDKLVSKSEDIVESFKQTISQQSDQIIVNIITTEPLGDISALSTTITAKIHKPVTIKTEVNPEIIGGMIVVIGDYKIDMSVKSRLLKVKTKEDKAKIELPEYVIDTLKIIMKNI